MMSALPSSLRCCSCGAGAARAEAVLAGAALARAADAGLAVGPLVVLAVPALWAGFKGLAGRLLLLCTSHEGVRASAK